MVTSRDPHADDANTRVPPVSDLDDEGEPDTRSKLSRSRWLWLLLLLLLIACVIGIITIAVLSERAGPASTTADERDAPTEPATPAPEPEVAILGELNPYEFGPAPKNVGDFWQIPTSAPFDTFPDAPKKDGDYWACSSKQIAWLQEHALPYPVLASWGQFNVTLHHDADDAMALSLSNIRFEGEETPSDPLVRFSCPVGGVSGNQLQSILIGTDGSAARWSEAVDADSKPEGSPVTFELPAGEPTPLQLLRAPDVDQQRQYAGRFLADDAKTGETVVLAENVTFHRENVPGYFVGYSTAGWLDGKLYCGLPLGNPQFPEESVMRPCTLAEAMATLKEAETA